MGPPIGLMQLGLGGLQIRNIIVISQFGPGKTGCGASSTLGDDRTLWPAGRSETAGKSCPRPGRRSPEVIHGNNIDLEIPRSSCTGPRRLEDEWKLCTGTTSTRRNPDGWQHRLADSRRGGPHAGWRLEDDRESCTGTTAGGTKPDGWPGRRQPKVVHGSNIDLEILRNSCTGPRRLEEDRAGGGKSHNGRPWRQFP
jgi:hypothetical protein